MSPENNRDSLRFKLPHLGICLRRGGFTEEAILPNRVCWRDRKWRYWIREGWGYR